MSQVMYLIVGLLVVIVILLCTPLRQRASVVKSLLAVGALTLAVYYLAPLVVGLFAQVYQYALERFGWKGTLALAATAVCVPILYLVWRSDRNDNQAIRAGSVAAFNKRVEAYKRDPFNYSHEKAVETATRIRDGK